MILTLGQAVGVPWDVGPVEQHVSGAATRAVWTPDEHTASPIPRGRPARFFSLMLQLWGRAMVSCVPYT